MHSSCRLSSFHLSVCRVCHFLWILLSPHTWTFRYSPLVSGSRKKDGQIIPNSEDPVYFGEGSPYAVLLLTQYSPSGVCHSMAVSIFQAPLRWERLERDESLVQSSQGTSNPGSSEKLSCRSFHTGMLGSLQRH